MPAKKKTAKKAPPKVEAPASYIIAKCQWCGMEWKHFDGTPKHFCGKVCASHAAPESKPEPVED